MMRARPVVEHVLNKLESRDTDGIERLMIRTAGVTHGDAADPEVRERRNPLLEAGGDRGILLQIDSANLAGAIINVEVSGDLCLVCFDHGRPCRLAQEVRQLHLLGSLLQGHISEMLLYVSIGPKLAL